MKSGTTTGKAATTTPGTTMRIAPTACIWESSTATIVNSGAPNRTNNGNTSSGGTTTRITFCSSSKSSRPLPPVYQQQDNPACPGDQDRDRGRRDCVVLETSKGEHCDAGGDQDQPEQFARIHPGRCHTLERHIELLSRLKSAPESGKLQDPDPVRDHHDHVQHRLDATGHWDEPIGRPHNAIPTTQAWACPRRRRARQTKAVRNPAPIAESPADPGSGVPALPQPPTSVVPANVFAVFAKTQPLMVPASTPLPPAAADMVKLSPASIFPSNVIAPELPTLIVASVPTIQ